MRPTDYFTRPVRLYMMPDGSVVTRPIHGPAPTGHTGDWRDVAIDALLDGNVDRVKDVLAHNEREPMCDVPEQQLYTLPVFSVNTEAEALQIIVHFCKLAYEPHPLLEPRERNYVYSGEDFDPDDPSTLWVVAARFAEFYDTHVSPKKNRRRKRARLGVGER